MEQALKALKDGNFVVVMDDESRENEGDLVIAAAQVTEEKIAFMVRHCTGIICVPTYPERLQSLNLPLMLEHGKEMHQCKFAISVDLKEANTTGVSAADRARTIRSLADPNVPSHAFNRPGHVFPLLAQKAGVLVRGGHTEASVDLMRLAGYDPAISCICELNTDQGKMMRRPQLEAFAKEHGLPLVSIPEILRYRLQHETLVEQTQLKDEETAISTPMGSFKHVQFCSQLGDNQDIVFDVLLYGIEPITGTKEPVGVYLQDETFQAGVEAQWALDRMLRQDKKGLVIYQGHANELLASTGINSSSRKMIRRSLFGLCMQILQQLQISSIHLYTSRTQEDHRQPPLELIPPSIHLTTMARMKPEL